MVGENIKTQPQINATSSARISIGMKCIHDIEHYKRSLRSKFSQKIFFLFNTQIFFNIMRRKRDEMQNHKKLLKIY
jgi:hypothetical protein